MPDRFMVEQLAGTPPDFNGYSSYHLHKSLEMYEGILERDDLGATAEIREAAQILVVRLSAWLLRRYRAHLDSPHERELIEDWNWSQHEN